MRLRNTNALWWPRGQGGQSNCAVDAINEHHTGMCNDGRRDTIRARDLFQARGELGNIGITPVKLRENKLVKRIEAVLNGSSIQVLH